MAREIGSVEVYEHSPDHMNTLIAEDARRITNDDYRWADLVAVKSGIQIERVIDPAGFDLEIPRVEIPDLIPPSGQMIWQVTFGTLEVNEDWERFVYGHQIPRSWTLDIAHTEYETDPMDELVPGETGFWEALKIICRILGYEYRKAADRLRKKSVTQMKFYNAKLSIVP